MSYGFYILDDGRRRGYMVDCKCHKRGCAEPINRGLSYLCYSCTWYFCTEHLTRAYDATDNAILADCFAGQNSQVCQRCAHELECDARDAEPLVALSDVLSPITPTNPSNAHKTSLSAAQ